MWGYTDDKGRLCTTCYVYNTVCKSCRVELSKKQYKSKAKEHHLWDWAKSRAKERGIEFNIEVSDILIPEICPILKTKITKPSLDRIDNSRGYVKGNVRVISYYANMIKSSLSIEEIKNLYDYVCEI
jgi:hypothetical protein